MPVETIKRAICLYFMIGNIIAFAQIKVSCETELYTAYNKKPFKLANNYVSSIFSYDNIGNISTECEIDKDSIQNCKYFYYDSLNRIQRKVFTNGYSLYHYTDSLTYLTKIDVILHDNDKPDIDILETLCFDNYLNVTRYIRRTIHLSKESTVKNDTLIVVDARFLFSIDSLMTYNIVGGGKDTKYEFNTSGYLTQISDIPPVNERNSVESIISYEYNKIGKLSKMMFVQKYTDYGTITEDKNIDEFYYNKYGDLEYSVCNKFMNDVLIVTNKYLFHYKYDMTKKNYTKQSFFPKGGL